MSEALRGLDTSPEANQLGPNYFGYYSYEVAELLSQTEDYLPFSSQTPEIGGGTCEDAKYRVLTERNCNDKKRNSFIGSGSLFCDAVGAHLSDCKKERLRVLLRQSVAALTREVDEMMDPVINMRRIKARLRYKRSVNSEVDAEKQPHKRLKLSSSSSSIGIEKESLSIEDQRRGSLLGSNIEAERENEEVNYDFQFLLENDYAKVEETMKKHSDELSKMLGQMEQKLEELLDTIMFSCRPMNLVEKQHLQRLIQKLPAKNLDRIVEIIRRRKPLANCSSDEVRVDLEEEDDVSLWRMYFYVVAVENARKLSV